MPFEVLNAGLALQVCEIVPVHEILVFLIRGIMEIGLQLMASVHIEHTTEALIDSLTLVS